MTTMMTACNCVAGVGDLHDNLIEQIEVQIPEDKIHSSRCTSNTCNEDILNTELPGILDKEIDDLGTFLGNDDDPDDTNDDNVAIIISCAAWADISF